MKVWLFSSNGHLTGSGLAAFADGELHASDHEAVAEHLTTCRSCGQALDRERHPRDLLRSGPEPEISEQFAARLASVPASNCGRSSFDGNPIPPGVRRRRRAGIVASGVVVVALGVLIAWGAENADTVVPIAAASVADDPAAPEITGVAADAGQLRAEGWIVPERLAEQVALRGAERLPQGGIRLTYGTPSATSGEANSDALIVVESAGRLDSRAAAGCASIAVAGYEVSELSTAPWGVMWQSGSRVVIAVSPRASRDEATPLVEALYADLPVANYDDSVGGKLSRGLVALGHVFGR